jgi:hypothetical protein
VTSAETALATALELKLSSLSPSHRHLIRLEQDVFDGIDWLRGPHTVGWVERTPDGLRVKLIPTRAGETARALLEEQLLEVVLSHGYRPVIRLVGG